ncbi:MAG: RNA polymerase factor sigma-54 [Ktedonobacterales bacterium]
MNQEQVQEATPQQGWTIAAKLITSIRILQYSAEELEQSIAHEVDENPALEVDEQALCVHCGTVLHMGVCPSCHGQNIESVATLMHSWDTGDEFDYQDHDLSVGEDRDYDPLELIRASRTLGEHLLRLLGGMLPLEDQPIAEYLVGNLDSHGYLIVSIAETASMLNVSEERVEAVLRVLQSLDPPGIGARNLRECLLIQLESFEQQGTSPSIARRLLEGHLTELGEHHFVEIAHELGVSSSQVMTAWHFIRANLNPYPAHTFEFDEMPDLGLGLVSERSTLIRPDVVIRRVEGGFEAEVVERRRYRFNLNAGYQALYQQCKAHSGEVRPGLGTEERQHIRQYAARARFFMECVSQRWDTLMRIADALIVHQYEFLEKGVRFLKPFTRSELALNVGLHESTVSRAIANKYVLLPSGRTVPFDDFFDGSLAAKDAIREIIDAEDSGKPYSDEKLAQLLSERSIPLARRTVAKYREALGIMPSRFRI